MTVPVPTIPLVTPEQVKAHLEGKFTNPDSRADYVAMIIAHLVNFPTGSLTSTLRADIVQDAARAEANPTIQLTA
ncbi:MAG: hypothetical protein ABS95_01205 [Verrucomicrobia bacterium SCN 57-15]|nr:MAG: hypothetical protein ABS95_01205 [Verrucomicrobia bacterium SCN 57-15]